MRTLLLSLILIGIALPALFGQANSSPVSVSQSVSTDSIYSTIFKRKVATTIILPANCDENKSYPVFYLLHPAPSFVHPLANAENVLQPATARRNDDRRPAGTDTVKPKR